jgi:phage shock protein A
MTECSRCKCGECAAPLEPLSQALREVFSSKLREQVQSIFKEEYKDQKVLEVETTQAIAARLAGWAKLLGFFIGIPIAAFLVVLGLIGIRTYSDLSAEIKKAHLEASAKITDVSNRIAEEQKSAGNLESQEATLSKEFLDLETSLGNLKALSAQVETLKNDYQKAAANIERTKQLADRVDSLDRQVVNLNDSVRSALVLGNSHYPKLSNGGQLQRSVNDARAVRDACETRV